MARDQPGPKGRTTSAWELVQGRLGGPVPCLRTTRSTGEDRLQPETRPWDPTESWDSGETGKGNELGESELTGPPWPTWFTPFGEGVPSGAYQDSTSCSGPFGEGGTSPELTAPLPRAQDHSAKVLRTVRRGGTVRSLPRLYLVLRTVGSGDENQ